MNRKGFTLIEILVAGALFITIIGGFNYLLKTAGAQSRAAAKLSAAVNLARGEMEKLRARPGTDELEAIEVTVRWDARKPPVHLISLRSND